MAGLFEKAGFDVEENVPIFAIDTNKLLTDEKILTILKKPIKGVHFASLEELKLNQLEELCEILSTDSIRFSSAELAGFSRNLSGVVFDDAGALQSFILVTESVEKGAHIDFLYSAKKENSSFVLAVLQGMLTEIYASGGAKRYPVITTLCADDNITHFMNSVLPEKPEQLGMTIYAKKELTAKTEGKTKIEAALDEDMEGEWHREIAKVSMQKNIGWKVLWYRDRQRNRVAKKAVREDAVSENMFPYELSDPLDMDYGYEKDEDETEGLIHDDARRITIDNLEQFKNILPADAYQDLPRPWHRGLAVGSGDNISYLVYELKDMDEKKDGHSEIRWLELTDDGGRLFSEFRNELQALGVGRSTMETDLEKKALLSEAGYATEERESEAISVTVDELTALPFVSRKTPDYVKGLRDISQRQFKRGLGSCMIHGRTGLLEDMEYLPMEWFEQDVSSVVLMDGRVSGMLLVHQLPSKRLSVDLLFASSGDVQLDIMRMITHSVRAAVDKYPKDTPVLLRRHNSMVHHLTDRLFADKKGEKILYGERKEV
ncbi:MAG: hypothetical protein IJ648_00235 [Lachnospiraceae bacterium]|nr:hypothetical protein [Lachnospiraceae bacterium]MBR1856886.1 hypothetical protein [Oribacterium sp.]